MPCDSGIQQIRDEALRREAERAREEELTKLDRDIAAGRVRVARNARGELFVPGWEKLSASLRGKWCDGCALVAIGRGGSWLARAALAQQGVTAGKSFTTVGHGHPHKA